MPFLKWMGGKSQVLHIFKDYFPDFYGVKGYIEPFMGGGSVYFYIMENFRGALEGKPIFVSDINKELINCYKVVRDNVDKVIPLLEEHQKLNSEEYYYEIRKKYPPGNDMTDIEKAAAFIYLSRAAFGGLWRVNSEGKMNAPFNKNPAIKIMDDGLYDYSRLLKPANINVMSFENILKINKGDLKDWFVYCCLLGTKIRMSDERLLNIEDIKKDDKTFIGGKVIDIFERDYNGKIFEFEIMGIYDNLCVTEEHPLAIIRQNDAYQILERYSDSRIHISKFKNQEALNRLDIKFIRSKDINIGDFLLVPCYPENIIDIKTVKIGDIEVDCNEEFGYIIGFWLAEGHIEHYYGKYCIDKDRLNDIKTGKQSTIFDIFDTGDGVDEDIDELIKKNDCDSSYILEYSCGELDFDHGFISRLDKWYNHYFKITGNIRKLPWDCWQISYHLEDLAKFLHKNFGEGAGNKKISNEILNYPLEFQKGLLRGWIDGDGGIWGDEGNRCKITGTSTSRQLALDIYLIALRLGLKPALKSRQDKQLKSKLQWDTYFSSQDDVKCIYPDCHDFVNSITRSQRRIIIKGNKKFILSPITKIIKREYRGKVYNLQTEKHVYIANYVLNHNCDPPYADTGHGAFTGYSKDGYHAAKRDLLPKVFKELDKKRAKVMMSNADVPAMRNNFSDFNINVIKTNRQTGIQLSSITKDKIEKTEKLNEVVITNYNFGKCGKQRTIDDTWV